MLMNMHSILSWAVTENKQTKQRSTVSAVIYLYECTYMNCKYHCDYYDHVSKIRLFLLIYWL